MSVSKKSLFIDGYDFEFSDKDLKAVERSLPGVVTKALLVILLPGRYVDIQTSTPGS